MASEADLIALGRLALETQRLWNSWREHSGRHSGGAIMTKRSQLQEARDALADRIIESERKEHAQHRAKD